MASRAGKSGDAFQLEKKMELVRIWLLWLSYNNEAKAGINIVVSAVVESRYKTNIKSL